MIAGWPVHVIEAQVHQMGQRDQRSADADRHRMGRIGVVVCHEHARHQQANPRQQQPEGAKTAVFTPAVGEADAGQHDGKRYESALVGVIGQECQTERRQYAKHQRQQRAMYGAQKRGQRTEAIE